MVSCIEDTQSNWSRGEATSARDPRSIVVLCAIGLKRELATHVNHHAPQTAGARARSQQSCSFKYEGYTLS